VCACMCACVDVCACVYVCVCVCVCVCMSSAIGTPPGADNWLSAESELVGQRKFVHVHACVDASNSIRHLCNSKNCVDHGDTEVRLPAKLGKRSQSIIKED
jgi:hypothetical protein